MSLDSKTDSLVEQYVRAPLPQSQEALPQYLEQELQRIEAFTQDASHGSVTVANAEPEVKKKGTVRFAVSPWDPIGGSFQGLVVYNGSAWVRVDTDTNTQNTLSDLGITSSAANINKYTAGTDLVIDASGNVGIGTTSPHTKTEIVTTASGSVSESLQIRNNATASGTGSKIRMINSTDVNSDANSVSITSNRSNDDNFMTFETEDIERMRINSDGRTQITANKPVGFACELFNDGNNNNRYGLHLQCGTDDASGTNYAITFYDGNVTSQGNITFTSGTVTYGAFTAHHEISLPDEDKSSGYPYGTLLETTDIYYTQKDGSDTERGIRYVTQKSSSQYSKKILGTYCGDLLAVADGDGTYANNLHQAAVLGDGHIICNNSGGNIKVGDGICASATAGIGQKADKLCMIIGIAQKDITFSGSETVLVPVQYGLQQFTPWTD